MAAKEITGTYTYDAPGDLLCDGDSIEVLWNSGYPVSGTSIIYSYARLTCCAGRICATAGNVTKYFWITSNNYYDTGSGKHCVSNTSYYGDCTASTMTSYTLRAAPGGLDCSGQQFKLKLCAAVCDYDMTTTDWNSTRLVALAGGAEV